MNWNADIRDLTGRQILWVALGIIAFCGLLYFLVAYEYKAVVAVVALIVLGCARWYQANREQDRLEAGETGKTARERERANRLACREYAGRHIEDRRNRTKTT